MTAPRKGVGPLVSEPETFRRAESGISYHRIRELASGGMGTVELAMRREGRFRRLYVLKRVRPELRDLARRAARAGTETGRQAASLMADVTFSGIELAGHFSANPRLGIPSRVIAVDPETLATETLIDYGPETFGAATTALQVGREIWIGTARDQGLARFRLPAGKLR